MGDGLSLVIILIAVAVVIYLSFLFSKYISVGAFKMNASKYIEIIDRIVVGQDRFIMIICVQEKHYLISVTEDSIRILKELEGFEVTNNPQTGVFGTDPFKNILQNIIKTKKK